MSSPLPPKLGIIGGMGPHAGLLLADRVLASTRATTDQDHLSFVVISYSDRTPDRTAWLEDPSRPDPAPAILDAALTLAAAGVHHAGIACNTAHVPAIHTRVLAELEMRAPGLEMLHLVRETAAFASEAAPGARRIGILSTLGSYRAGLYATAIEAAGLTPVLPTEHTKHEVNRSIFDRGFGLKAFTGRVSAQALDLLVHATTELRAAGAEAVVLGCTELSLVHAEGLDVGLPAIDSTTALARALVRRAAPDRLLPLAS